MRIGAAGGNRLDRPDRFLYPLIADLFTSEPVGPERRLSRPESTDAAQAHLRPSRSRPRIAARVVRPTPSAPPTLASLRSRDRPARPGAGRAPEPSRGDRPADRPGQAGEGLEIWSPAREDEVIARVLAASGGPLPPETLRLIFRELMSGSRGLAEDAPGRLPGAEVQLQPPGLGRQVRRRPSSTSRSARSPRSSRRSTAATSSSASSRWRTRPTAGSPTPWRCSSACRASRSAPRSGCGSIIACSAAASGARCGGSTPRPRPCRSAGTGWARTCRRRRSIAWSRRPPPPSWRSARSSPPPSPAAPRRRRYGLNVLAANIEDQSHNVTRFAVIAEQHRAAHRAATRPR